MTKPCYVQAFEHFRDNGSNDNQLKSLVAFALYVDAECKWASSQSTWPSDARYKNFYEATVPHQASSFVNGAEAVLTDFANSIVELEQPGFLQSALDAYRVEAAKADHGFWYGVGQGLVAALLWSLAIILAVIIFNRLGVDILGAFEKASGH